MTDEIRLGIIGANLHRGWAYRSHLPAVAASPGLELTAVCTTRMESAEETRQTFGAKLAFDDYRAMVAHPDVDAVVVSVKVPDHYEPTMAALDAGKHVYTEWPLGRTTAEAEEMAALARSKGLRNMVGLQARADPAILYAKDLVEEGYVGEVMSCRVSRIGAGGLQRGSDRIWQRDKELGANTLTISCGHTIDALRYIVGDFGRVSAVVSTQLKEWLETDTGRTLAVTSPDNVLINGRLESGAVASVHVATIPWAGSGYHIEIYGLEGSLFVSGDDPPNAGSLRVRGVKGADGPEDLEVPGKYRRAPDGMPGGSVYNVGQMHHRFRQSILSGNDCQPDFNTAVELHRLIDSIQEASDSGQEVAVT